MISLDTYRNLFNLKGKVAIVAGGAGGIGSAICEGLAAFGATVVVCGRTGAKAEELAADINAAGGQAWGVELDILNIEHVRQFVPEVVSRYGSADVMINCVGMQIEAPAEEYSEKDWDQIFTVNLKSAFFLSQTVAREQIPKGGGKHIHISSVRSLLGIHRGFIGYCTSKGGMNLMIKQLATEWAKHNINVNGIAPTFIRTELVKQYLEDPNFYNPLVARIPMGRVGEPLDLAGLAVYLSAPAADFITGQIIFADGGVTACQ
jgi:NAD(P)-dependent dehydrogenase (short-subunit alcohol dehydrogenase family)